MHQMCDNFVVFHSVPTSIHPDGRIVPFFSLKFLLLLLSVSQVLLMRGPGTEAVAFVQIIAMRQNWDFGQN